MAYGPFFLPDLSYPFTCPCTCVSTYRPFTGPCTCNGPCTCSPFTGPCTCVCVVRVFAQFSMACVRFRPRRASPTFSRVHVPPVHGSVYVCVPRTWFCPVFHGARPVPSTTGVGHFFPVSTYSPFTGPCMCVPRTWFCPGFHVRTSRSVHDGGRPLFPRVHVQPVHGSV